MSYADRERQRAYQREWVSERRALLRATNPERCEENRVRDAAAKRLARRWRPKSDPSLQDDFVLARRGRRYEPSSRLIEGSTDPHTPTSTKTSKEVLEPEVPLGGVMGGEAKPLPFERADPAVQAVVWGLARERDEYRKGRQKPDGSLERLRSFLSSGRGWLMDSIRRLSPRKVVDELLAASGVWDLSPKRRGKWAVLLESKFGRSAGVLVLSVLLSVAKDSAVRSVGAVVAYRLPQLLSADPRRAMWPIDPDTPYSGQFIYLERPKAEDAGPIGVMGARECLAMYRKGSPVEHIAKVIGFPEADVKKAVQYALRSGMS